MAIWSLTQERVEKLLKQIGDKEDEIDALIKLSPKDLWNIDLDAFVEEWDVQLSEEAERAKKIQRMGRRASHKLGIGASKGGKAKKKRKMGSDSDDSGSDSDFGPVKKKTKAKSGGLLSYLREADAPSKEPSPAVSAKSTFGSAAPQKSTQTSLLSHLKADVKKESPPQTDGPLSPAEPEAEPAPKPAAKPRGRQAAAKKAAPVISDDDEDDSDVFAVVAKEEAKKPVPAPKTNGRAPRAAAAKPVSKYSVDTDSDDDDDLGDVSTMVKSIGGTTNGVPLFKTSTRPGSSSGMPKVAKKASPSVIDIDEGDTTNYEALMPVASPRKPAPRNANDTMLSDSEDDFSLVKSKPAASKLTKITAKAKTVPKAKAPAAAVTKKSTALSPAAKAYAKRLEKDESVGASKPKAAPAKKPKVVDSDEEMDDADTLANEILSDDDDEPTPKPKPTSRAPAARPGRRAAAKPAKYVVSDDDDEDDASEASFDGDSE
jgi:DNA topoisomerase-2